MRTSIRSCSAVLAAVCLGAPGPIPLATAAASQEGQAPDGVTDLERLRELAREIEPQVAELRGLEFLHPVAVELASHEQLEAYALERLDAMQSRAQRLAYEEMLEMLGLAPAGGDLEATLIELLQSQVAGFYDPATDTFYLVHGLGEALARSTMAHELVHALDDQHVDLDERLGALIENGDAASAFHAVMEGGASEIQSQWVLDNLSREEQLRMATQAGDMGAGLTDGPEILWRPLLHSYLQGSAFLKRSAGAMSAALRKLDRADLMRAFETPPRSTEQVLHPEKYWDESQLDEPTAVAHRALDDSGWEILHSDTFGELGLAILVDGKRGSRAGMDPMRAMMQPFSNAAAKGWDGDRATLFARGPDRYLRLDTVWDSPAEASEFAAALEPQLDSMRAALGALAAVAPDGTAAEGAARTTEVSKNLEGDRVALNLWLGPSAEPAPFELVIGAPVEAAPEPEASGTDQ